MLPRNHQLIKFLKLAYFNFLKKKSDISISRGMSTTMRYSFPLVSWHQAKNCFHLVKAQQVNGPPISVMGFNSLRGVAQTLVMPRCCLYLTNVRLFLPLLHNNKSTCPPSNSTCVRCQHGRTLTLFWLGPILCTITNVVSCSSHSSMCSNSIKIVDVVGTCHVFSILIVFELT